jgi:cell division protein FtsQ
VHPVIPCHPNRNLIHDPFIIVLSARRPRIWLRALGRWGTLCVLGLGFLFWASLSQALYHGFLRCSKGLGLEVRELCVTGRSRTKIQEIFWALKVKKGTIVWDMPLSQQKMALEKLPWVKKATLIRRYPSELRVQIQEKTPLALWQHQGLKHVLDESGHVIPGVVAEGPSPLMVITGQDSPQHFSAFYAKLHPFLEKLPKIKAATYLRSGRWNLYLKGGTLVKLPESQEKNALMTLITLLPSLSKQTSIDLRFPEAIILDPKPL